ncbi:MAG: hypothetical protein HY702_02260 [Gemmatimonadetes bacterium]|nr:hypothetical protein [Gemmatimonadota bacterium]
MALLAASGGAKALFAPELEVPELAPAIVTGRWAGFWADTSQPYHPAVRRG